MATCSWPPSQACSPVNQGQLGPKFLPASPELGKVTLEWVIRLLWGLQSQVNCIEQTLLEQNEINQEVCTNIKNISQAVNVVKDGLAQIQLTWGPHTPEDQKPPTAKETPQAAPKAKPIGKAQPFIGDPAPIISTGAPRHNPLTLFNPYPSSSFPWGPAPATQGPPPAPQVTLVPPPAPSTVKAVPNRPGGPKFPPHEHDRGWWSMGPSPSGPTRVHCVLIQTVDEFKVEFLAAFGNPDATQAAEWKITSLTQTGTCAKYITKFCMLQMELDWNNAALCGQFAHGLHCKVQKQIAMRERQPWGKYRPTGHQNWPPVLQSQLCVGGRAQPPLHRRLCVKCGKPGHRFAKYWTRWKAAPKDDKGKAKETVKTGKDSKYQLGKDPQAGKIWKKASLAFSLDEKQMTETFLICNTGSHNTILGLKWLDAHNLEIDWNLCTLSFPHIPPEHMAIAKEEEANQNPLEGVPSKYHQYAKVFGEEEFNKLPPHWHYNIGIELTEEGPLNSPLYSMTNAKSATLKDWLRDKLKAGKIHPSKSSISSPVMFVPKKDGSCCLVVDYCHLNNWTKKNIYPLPCPDDLMAQLCGAKVFTKLDLQWGYNNVWVKEGNKWKTAFHTKYGLYKSLVMTFGLTNTPTAFQHFMNKLFKDLLDVCIIIYLDDILIYSKDDTSHTQHVHEVLQHLMENQLFARPPSAHSILDKLKIQAVQEWPTPTKVKEVQSFLGFANFLQHFIANVSHTARPLHNLVKKDMPWKWDTKEQEAFQGLKDAITNAQSFVTLTPQNPTSLKQTPPVQH
ncbi:hypothetical protein RHS01_10555 [Rhizoctonia solani]|uniref:Reverse transcriptase domain-containing protein n=1 Tax=Rhizoctonia solani TaxID=456999 RepID=A0A8H7I387_9AGAM|nr:hypothetical protein RHS01_10555 [Rhizoctonia solani]